MRYHLFLFLGLLFCVASQAIAGARWEQSLAGQWRFALDPKDTGTSDTWFNRTLPDHLHLPGTLEEQGFGNPPSIHSHWLVNDSSLQTFIDDPRYAPYRSDKNFKSPFWLTPKRHYVGVAWYQRTIDIPVTWGNKRIMLHLERPHWQTTLWLDDHLIGSNDSLGTPHDYELPGILPGKHTLTIRIDNRLIVPVGPHADSVTDMSQTDWNGIIGDISLIATNKIWFDEVQVFPDIENHEIHVISRIGNRTGKAGDETLTASIGKNKSRVIPIHLDDDGSAVEFDYPLGPSIKLWDEFAPNLYALRLRLSSGDECNTTFGLRQVTRQGNQFFLNGRPMQVRGTLECCVFPLTGYPPTTRKPWRRIFTIARSYGLNHMRFHTWCPPEAAFEAADAMGFYLEVECSCWGHLGEGKPQDKWMPAEGDRMLRAYGNHPSFMFMVATNEPKGAKAADFLADVIEKWKKKDSRRLYSAGAGADYVKVPQSDFRIEYATRFHQAKGELTRPPQTADDYSQFINQQPIPCIAHELGQWCAYPDFKEIPEFNGFLEPTSLEIFHDFLSASGMGGQDRDFVNASGHFQSLLYKAEIEKVLRTPHMGGFELLDLHDFPGQGYSPVGVLDEFWDSKGYITPAEYRRFAGPIVPLARFSKLVFTSDESPKVSVEISNFGPVDLNQAAVVWRIRDTNNRTLRSGRFPSQNIPAGRLSPFGSITLPLAGLPSPGKFNLQIQVPHTKIANDWDFWVYPSQIDLAPPRGITIIHDLDSSTLNSIGHGATVLALIPPAKIAGNAVDTFEPIFWNRVLFPHELSQTMGILCDPRCAALRDFPTDSFSNWQWWDLQQNSKPMILDSLPRNLSPIIQLIDDWTECHKLGLLIEARLGKGKILICSIDLQTNLAHRPVARQLLHSLLGYAASKSFSPRVDLTPEQIRSLLQR